MVFGPFNGSKILMTGIFSRDGVDVVSPAQRKTADSLGVYNLTKNDVVGLAWHYAPNTKLLNKLVISWYRNQGNTNLNSKFLTLL